MRKEGLNDVNHNVQIRARKIMTSSSRPSDSVIQLIESIEHDVILGRILPSSRLIEDHLMEDYAAKRHVVRSALVELGRLGVVVKPPHLGASIRRFDRKSLAALYHMRSVLHRAAVELFPLPVDLDRIESLVRAQKAHETAAASGNLVAIHAANMAFHREFYGLCGNPYLDESIRLHDWLSFPARAYGIADRDALELACRDHAEMVACVQSCDRERLIQLSLSHMNRAREIYETKFLAL